MKGKAQKYFCSYFLLSCDCEYVCGRILINKNVTLKKKKSVWRISVHFKNLILWEIYCFFFLFVLYELLHSQIFIFEVNKSVHNKNLEQAMINFFESSHMRKKQAWVSMRRWNSKKNWIISNKSFIITCWWRWFITMTNKTI